MKGIPIGKSDFKEVRGEGLYFIDKTPLIDEILKRNGTSVFLFTRPRRFGKSMNLSMLDAYLNLEYKGNHWFDDLAISTIRPDDHDKNSCPVIRISLKQMDTRSFDSFLSSFSGLMSRTARRFRYLLRSDAVESFEKKIIDDIVNMNAPEEMLGSSLLELSMMLETHHGKKPIILIDEYDDPVNSSEHEARREILGFLRIFLGLALKDNDSLKFAVITGVMQISEESIFSGLNNLEVNNIFTKRYDEMFGFTEDEVKRICNDYGHPEKYGEAKEWYDGYRFGDAKIYNPWSILCYVDSDFTPDCYWSHTANVNIIEELLSANSTSVLEDIRSLSSQEPLRMIIRPTVTFEDMKKGDGAVFSILTMSGYLSAEPVRESTYSLRIPNKEMERVYSEEIIGHFKEDLIVPLDDFLSAMLNGDVEAMSTSLFELADPILGMKNAHHEDVFEGFIAGMMIRIRSDLEVKTEGQEGSGFYDIRGRSLHGNNPNFIIGIKVLRSNSDFKTSEEGAKRALEQIHGKRYYADIHGRTLLYGICFDSKEPYILKEGLSLR